MPRQNSIIGSKISLDPILEHHDYTAAGRQVDGKYRNL